MTLVLVTNKGEMPMDNLGIEIDDHAMLDMLQALCPTVDNYLSQELYLMDMADDSVTPRSVLNECYMLVLHELKSLGILPNGDDTDLLEDMYTAQVLYYMRLLFDSKEMYTLFKHDAEAREYIDHLVNDHERDESEYIWKILEFLEHKYPNRKDVNRCAERAMEFHSTSALKDHLLAILEMVVPVDDSVIHNIDEIKSFIKKQMETRQKLSAVVNKLIESFKELDSEYLRNVVTNYDSEKLLPDNMNKWCIYLKMKEHKVAGDIPAEYIEMEKHHKRENKHHIEYYIHHRVHPTKENLVELMLHVYNDNDDKISYLKELGTVVEKAEEHELFVGNERDLLTRYSQVLYT